MKEISDPFFENFTFSLQFPKKNEKRCLGAKKVIASFPK
jgi:hypothetical protein